MIFFLRRGGTALLPFLLALVLAPAVWAQSGSTEERLRDLERQVEQLQAEIAAMKGAGAGAETARVDELERRLEVLAAEIEKLKIGEAAAAADQSTAGLGPAASKIYRTERGLSLGGYGEFLYQHADEVREAEEKAAAKAGGEEEAEEQGGDRLDLRRAVLYFGYKWNDRILFNSEVEYEHAGEEVSVEFAYLDFRWRPELNLRAGLLLMPVGFLNELHEPTVFLGADRPGVEQRILPATWRETGFGLFGEAGPFSYRTYVVNGLDAAGFTDDGLRGGRQGGSEAKAEDLAWVGRLDYTGRPGWLAGGSVYTGRAGQGLESAAGRKLGVRTTIAEGHLEWRWRGLEFRALGARAELSDVAQLNAALGLEGDESIGERLAGFYFQLGYDLLAGRAEGRALIPYARWESLNTQAAVPAGFSANPDTEIETLTFGVAYKPIEQVVLKVDYQNVDNRAGTGADRFTVLLGYVF
jgi:cell division protein FtsB